MKRDLGALADREFDLVVVGAGVYGAAIAWDASLRGLRVALIERDDFGSGTSFNNFKTIHGGIRYLQHADLKRVRESVRERSILMRIAPHLVHPLPFLVPTYDGSLTKGRSAMRMALLLNDLASWDRNRDLPREKHIPSSRSLSRDECLELAPGLDREGLNGGALWHDAQMYNSDRLTLSFVLSAADEGAVVANHVEATGFLREGSRIQGVRARDGLTGAGGLEIRGRTVVNASGPFVDRLLEKIGIGRAPLFHFSKAMNLVTRPLVENVALGLTRGGPLVCVAPWRDVAIVGTSHAPYEGKPEELEATEEDISSLLASVNAVYPEARLERKDVRLVHRGLLPSVPSNGEGVTLLKSYRIEDHSDEGIEGLLSVVGVKYTTARDVAEKVVTRALARLGEKPVPSRSSSTPVVGGDFESFSELAKGVAPRHLAASYGSRFRDVLAIGDNEPLSSSTSVLGSEIRHAVREEMAVDLSSVVLRRTELGSAGHPGRDALERAASIVAEELSWNDEKRRAEIDALEAFYRSRS
jgi:glycerol-3-phosphate dehydrogenase